MPEQDGRQARVADGLTSAEAERRLAQYGPNDVAGTRRTTAAFEFLRLFLNPLVGILLVASGVSVVVGEVVNATIIVVIVLLSVILDFVQTFRSQRAANNLLRSVTPTATALRDGEWQEVARSRIVPGDLIRLAAGDLVPADARLVTATHLHVQEAALTGESMPVEKTVTGNDDRPADVFLGTSVVSGSATALVVATGSNTAFGEIIHRLSARPPETEFERGTRSFSLLITRTVGVLVLVVFAINLAAGRSPLDTLLFAVALSVGLTPEFLPMITAVTLTQGALHMSRQHVIVKHLAAIENLGSIDVLCSDKTGTLTTSEMHLAQACDALGADSPRPRELALINSQLQTGIRSPLDEAILRGAPAGALSGRKLDEIPFDFERRRLSIMVELEGARLLITKGAPEGILERSVALEHDGGVVSLTPPMREAATATFRSLSAEGFRVLAVAWRAVAPAERYDATDERDLILAGYLAFLDPPLPDVAETVRLLDEDGVALKILTGDNDLVTRHICQSIDMDTSHIITGDEIERMSDTDLAVAAERCAIFARISPAQKQRIILALKSRGHVVGFLGDGVNDAPSLHAADVGISVMHAVDVAKDAADIILLEPNLRVLHSGIIEGRKAFGNVIKYILMGTSSNFGNMFSMAGASAFLPFLPMLPSQILLNNFLYDLAQVTIPTDRVDPSFSHRPRRWNVSIIRTFMIVVGPVSSLFDFLTFFFLLRVLSASEKEFHTGWFIESLITQTLVLLVIRTAANPLRSRPSRPLVATLLAVVLAGIALPYTPLATPLGFTRLPPVYFAFLLVATATYLLLVERAKRRVLRWD